jgi:hypothetical protein
MNLVATSPDEWVAKVGIGLFIGVRGIGILRSSHSGDSQKFATPSNVLATVKIRQMGDAPSTSGLLRWRCYVTRAEE